VGISSITVAGFKSIRRAQTIELRPLTILAGANNSGKSSIMQPLLLMKQTLEAPFDPGAMLLDGPNVHLDSAADVLSRGNGRVNTFSIALVIENGRYAVSYSRSAKGGFEVDDAVIESKVGEIRLVEGMSHKAIAKLLPSGASREIQSLPGQWVVFRNRCLLTLGMRTKDGVGWVALGDDIVGRIGLDVVRMIHLSGVRGNPSRTYPSAAITGSFAGLFQDYFASMIEHWQEKRNRQLGKLWAAMSELGLASRVETRRARDGRIEVLVSRTPSDLVNLADVGLGVSQSLPAVVALLAASPGTIVYLEKPEIHLHPRAQVAMAGIIASAAKRGVIVVVETHSSLLLRGLQTLVAERSLPHDVVKLHWFQRGRDGTTTVKSADVDREGAFGDWPEDFDDVTLQSEGDYLSAVGLK
jgi:hypothetical protein